MKPAPGFMLGARRVGADAAPLVIAEVGINHDGDVAKALQLVDAAADAGCECVKMQCHIPDDEMVPNSVIPGNASESIWDMMQRCALDEADERRVQRRASERGILYLSTPFSRAAADRLAGLGVPAFKIGSGECNNYPLVEHVAAFGRPVLLSTGMNDIASIEPAVAILRSAGVPFAVLQCTSMYPTPYEEVHLGALAELSAAFPDAVLGLSDHSLGIHTAVAAVALGARILEKHFTVDRKWPGPDVPISITPAELTELMAGADAVYRALGSGKSIRPGEEPTIAFAYASVVAIRPVGAGETLTRDNVWVKRPGTGEIRAADYPSVLGRTAVREIPSDSQLSWGDLA